MDGYGIVSLIPIIIVITVAIVTRRTIEPLIIGALVGCVILYKGAFLGEFISTLTTVIGENGWYILVFGISGMVIAVLERSGSAMGFGDWGERFCKSKGMTTLVTWILGIFVFIDDYISILGVGAAMKEITDRKKIPREFLAFTLNSTGAAICVLIPISTWGIFVGSQYTGIGMADEGNMLIAYAKTVPFILYGIFTVLIVPLYGFGIIKVFGPIKKAMKRAEEGDVYSDFYHQNNQDELDGYTEITKSSAWNFVIPMGVIIAVTIYTQDIVIGMIVGFLICLVLFIPQKLLTLSQFSDTSLSGFKDMVLVTAIVITAFVLQKVNGELGLTEFVIKVAEPVISPVLLPLIAFLVCCFVGYCTGSFWGTIAIALPIMIPLANILGTNPFLVAGAIVSAGSFGSHMCFFCDCVTLTCAVTGISNIEYARNNLPLAAIPFFASVVGYIILGFIM